MLTDCEEKNAPAETEAHFAKIDSESQESNIVYALNYGVRYF